MKGGRGCGRKGCCTFDIPPPDVSRGMFHALGGLHPHLDHDRRVHNPDEADVHGGASVEGFKLCGRRVLCGHHGRRAFTAYRAGHRFVAQGQAKVTLRLADDACCTFNHSDLHASPIPWVVRIDGLACDVRTDDIASGFLALDQGIMVPLAHGLDVAEVEEQRRVTSMPDLVVHDGGAGIVPIAFYDETAATLAGVDISKQCLPTDAIRAVPSFVAVEASIFRTKSLSHVPGFQPQANDH